MARILPKDCKRMEWVIILLSVTFVVVASLAIYAVVASPKNEPEPQTSSPTLTPPPETTLFPDTTLSPDATPSPDTTLFPDTTLSPDTTPSPDTTTSLCSTTPLPETTSPPDTPPNPDTTTNSYTTPPSDTTPYPDTTPPPDTTSYPDTTPPPDTTSYPDTTSNPDTTSDPDATPILCTTPAPSTIPPTSTTPLPPYEGPVAFHVYNRGSNTEVNSTIRYENSYVNTGSMDLTTGVFRAPTDGTYVFNFIAPRSSNNLNDLCLNVRLDRNGLPIGNGPICGDSYEEWTPASFNAVLNLKLYDTVEMFLEQGVIKASKGSDPPRTHFTGFLLEGESAFHAYRTVDSFDSRKNETIPFHGLNTNIGVNFDLTTSTFTAPVNGAYFFQFSGSSNVTTDVILVRNDEEPMGYGYTRNTDWGSAGFHTLWPLQKEDKVYARLNTGQLDEADRDLKITNLLGFIVADKMSDSMKSSVHFHVIRTSGLYTGRPDGIGQLINYTRIISNEGEGMNASSGIFKAPESGIYAFHFTSHRGSSYIGGPNACSTVIQMRNNETIGAGSNCHSTYAVPIFFHSVLLLQTNDEIKMLLYEGDINAVIDHKMCAQFSGFLIYSTQGNTNSL